MKNRIMRSLFLATIFLKILVANGDEAAVEMDKGTRLLAKTQFADALSHFHRAIELQPGNYQALYRRATAYLALNRPKLAIDDLENSLKFKSDFKAAKVQKANIFLKMGELDKAAEIYRELEDNFKLGVVEENRELIKGMEYSGECDYIIDAVNKLLETQPLDESLYLARSECYRKRLEFKYAIRDLKKAISLKIDSTDVQFELAQVYYSSNDIFESLNVIRECLKYNPDHEKCLPFYKKIRKPVKILESMKSSTEDEKWEKCIEQGTKLIESQNDNVILSTAYRMRCKCNREQGDLSKAISDCSDALGFDESDVESYIERAEAYMEDSDFDSAISDFTEVLNHDPENEHAKDGIEKAKQGRSGNKKRDYYKILGVKRSATKREITKAYRKLAQKWHPDNFATEAEKKKAERKFIDIAAAKEVLTDEEKRRQFDNGRDPFDSEGNNHAHDFHGFHPFQGFGNGHTFFHFF